MRRIIRNSAITAIALVFLYWLIWLYDAGLRDPRFFDGWILFCGMGAQLLFTLRKKLPHLPLGRATAWMQTHIYIGYAVIVVFGFHTGISLPDGLLEWVLWLLFVIVVLSGVIGAYLSWSIPPKLKQNSERIIFEGIPALRSELAREVDNLATHAADRAGSPTISDLYVNVLHGFFKRPRNLFAHLRGSGRPLDRISGEIGNLERYLDKPGKETLDAIKDLVVAKDNLDFEYAHQGVLKTWLFVHIPATYGLIVLTVLHVAIVYAFSSGAP
ncbi:hypothetical protein MnTg02_01744 [bacterium MnTg02]|nr:hypothetical protein MnTg02_01744 [bacterium MnTg02]